MPTPAKTARKRKKPEPTRTKNPFASEIGERLVKARDASGYNQIAFAKALGISGSKLSNYENGWTVLPPEVLVKV